MARCPWFCARRYCLKFLNTSHLPRCKALMVVTFFASLSARSCPFTPACQTSASTAVFEDEFPLILCGTLYYGTSSVGRFGLAVRSCAGKQKDLSAVPLRLSSLFRSRGLWTVFDILPLTINDALQWLSSLPILMQESFWWCQCSVRYYSLPLSPPPGISVLRKQLGVKHV